MACVSLQGVSKRYRDVVAVSELDLEITDGEILMLIGPSGCGKTTVLRIIAGLETPDAGTVHFDDRDMSGVRPGERDIAMVFEGYALYPHLAVRDNLAFALQLRHTPPDEIDRRVTDVAEAMELGHLLARRTPGLATGEAQHVAVGRAVIREAPRVLLLDDALSHLDAQQRLEARAEVTRLHRELGSTIVSVTHDQAEAMAVGTRLAVMDEGVLMQIGTPQELYERPANLFVAGFIGSPPMNLLPAAQFEGVGELGDTIGMRPEHVSLGGPASDEEIALEGRCELVEYLGSQILVHLRVGGDEFVLLDDPADYVAVGDLVECRVRRERLHRFETVSGRALESRALAATS
jgi:ABC-type sugar transport system ATPase subunit